MNKLLTRDEFRNAVFERDAHKCVVCGAPAVDAHHIMERRLWEDGGYYISNGASVCEQHHIECESTEISTEKLRELCGITTILLPPHLYPDQEYDKWGNIIIDDEAGKRLRGELWYDESVQKILSKRFYDVPRAFSKYVKYPRTHHLPWSPTVPKDDRVMPTTEHLEGKRVIVTEKMDGECLPSDAKILLSNGNTVNIGKIVREKLTGLPIKGVDSDGQIVDTTITKVFNNGRNDTLWVKLYVQRPNGPASILYVTPDHKLITPSLEEIKAKDVTIGQDVLYVSRDPGISTIQYHVLLGKLLGDGSRVITYNKSRIQYAHKTEHESYIDWTNEWLGLLCTRNKNTYQAGFGNTHMVASYTKSTSTIHERFNHLFNSDGQKIVPNTIVGQLNAISVAFWFMDDGALIHSPFQRDRMQFSVCGFNDDSCNNLQQALQCLDIDTTITQHKGYRYINVSANSTPTLAKLIAPYVCESMRYKLPEQFRNEPYALPPKEKVSDVFKVTSVTIKNKKLSPHHRKLSTRYDIETGTHNYFANGVLVHNCTTMYDDYIHARSIDGRSHESRDWVKQFWSNEVSWQLPNGWRLCGENLYAEHSVHYEQLPSYFMGFSVWVRNVCLPWDETCEWFDLLGVVSVPVLYDGIYDEDAIKKATKDIRFDLSEGYVLRIADAINMFEFSKYVGKFVRPNHVQTVKHWMHGRQMVKNELA